MRRVARELETRELLEQWQKQPAEPSRSGLDDQAQVQHVAAALRRVAERRKAGGRRSAWIAAAAAAACALLVFGGLRWSESSPVASSSNPAELPPSVRLSFEAGPARVVDGHGHPLSAGASLSEGSELTARSGGVRVEFPSGARAALAEGTKTRVEHLASADEVLFLLQGEVDVEVPKRGPGASFSIATPDARVVVHGTRFRVTAEPGEPEGVTRVAVEHGVVSVHVAQREVARLTAGQSWPQESSEPDADVDESPRLDPSSSGPVERERPRRRVARKRARSQAKARVRPGLADENALFAEAMAHKRAGRSARALTLMNRFVARYPRSVLLQEARVERFRLLSRLNRTREAAASARSYLGDYPAGFARAEARQLALESP